MGPCVRVCACTAGISVLAALLSCTDFLPQLVSPPTFEMRELASAPYYPEYHFPIGDADRDSLPELYLKVVGVWDYIYIFEYGGVLSKVGRRAAPGFPWFVADLDRDGKADLVHQTTWNLQVYESRDSMSYPDSLVWDQYMGANGGAIFAAEADLDLDGAREILVAPFEPGDVGVFENTGDDAYELVCWLRAPTPGPRHVAPVETRDLDRDGKPELVAGKDYDCNTYFFEMGEADTMEYIACCSIAPSRGYVLSAAADDMDGDGRPEVVAHSFCYTESSQVAVIEATGDNQFEVVWRQRLGLSSTVQGPMWVAAGDIDGENGDEFAVVDGGRVRLFRCRGPDDYEQVWEAPAGWPVVGFHDIDGDGRDELFYCRYGSGRDWTVVADYLPSVDMTYSP